MNLLYKNELKIFFKRLYIFIAFFFMIAICTMLIISFSFPAFWLESEYSKISNDNPWTVNEAVTVEQHGNSRDPDAEFSIYGINWSDIQQDNIQYAIDYFFNSDVNHFIYDDHGNDIINDGISGEISTVTNKIPYIKTDPKTKTPQWQGDNEDVNYNKFFNFSYLSSQDYSFWHNDLTEPDNVSKTERYYTYLYDSNYYPNVDIGMVKNDVAIMRLILPFYNFNFYNFYFYNDILPKAYEKLEPGSTLIHDQKDIYNFKMSNKINDYKLSGYFFNNYASINLFDSPIDMDTSEIFYQPGPGVITTTPAAFILDDSLFNPYIKDGGTSEKYEGDIEDGTAVFSEGASQNNNIDVGQSVKIDSNVGASGLILKNVGYGFSISDFNKYSTSILGNRYTTQDYLTLSVNRNDFMSIFNYLFNLDEHDSAQSNSFYENKLSINHDLTPNNKEILYQTISEELPSDGIWQKNEDTPNVVYGGPEYMRDSNDYSDMVMQSNILYLIASLLVILLLVVSFIFISEEQVKKQHSFFRLKALGFSNKQIMVSSSLSLVLLITVGFLVGFITTIPVINWLTPYFCSQSPIYITSNHIFGGQIIIFFSFLVMFILFLFFILWWQVRKPLFHKNDGISLFGMKILLVLKSCFTFLPSPSRIKLIFALKNFKKNIVVLLVFIFGISIFIFSLQINYSIINFANKSSALFSKNIQTGYRSLDYSTEAEYSEMRNILVPLFFNGQDSTHSPGHDELIYSQSQIDDIEIKSIDDIPSDGSDWVLKFDKQSQNLIKDQSINNVDDLSHYYLAGKDITKFMTTDYAKKPDQTNYDHYCPINPPDNTPNWQSDLCGIYDFSTRTGLTNPPNIFFNRFIVDDADYKDQLTTLVSDSASFHLETQCGNLPPRFQGWQSGSMLGIDNIVCDNIMNETGVPNQNIDAFNKYIVNGDKNLELAPSDLDEPVHIPVFISQNMMRWLTSQIINGLDLTSSINLDDYNDDQVFEWMSKPENITATTEVTTNTSKAKTIKYTLDFKGYFYQPEGVNFPNNPDLWVNKTILQNMILNQPLNKPIDGDNISIDNTFYSTQKTLSPTSNLTYMIWGSDLQNVNVDPGFQTNYVLDKSVIAKQASIKFASEFIITQLLLYTIIFVMLAICIIFISDVLAENKNIIITMKILGYKSRSVMSYVIGSYFVSIILSFIFGYLISLIFFSIFSSMVFDSYSILLQVPLNFSVWLIPFLVVFAFVFVVGLIGYLKISKAPINNLSFDSN